MSILGQCLLETAQRNDTQQIEWGLWQMFLGTVEKPYNLFP